MLIPSNANAKAMLMLRNAKQCICQAILMLLLSITNAVLAKMQALGKRREEEEKGRPTLAPRAAPPQAAGSQNFNSMEGGTGEWGGGQPEIEPGSWLDTTKPRGTVN